MKKLIKFQKEVFMTIPTPISPLQLSTATTVTYSQADESPSFSFSFVRGEEETSSLSSFSSYPSPSLSTPSSPKAQKESDSSKFSFPIEHEILGEDYAFSLPEGYDDKNYQVFRKNLINKLDHCNKTIEEVEKTIEYTERNWENLQLLRELFSQRIKLSKQQRELIIQVNCLDKCHLISPFF
jgi:hypothetical protein